MHNVHKNAQQKLCAPKKKFSRLAKPAGTAKSQFHLSKKGFSGHRLSFFFGAQKFFYTFFTNVIHIKNNAYVQGISENKQEHHVTRKNYYTTGESDFVGFKEIIRWPSQESISIFQKSFFQTSTRLLFWRVEFFLRIFYACYAYEKQSLGSKESPSINQSIARHVEMIIRQERANLLKFRK